MKSLLAAVLVCVSCTGETSDATQTDASDGAIDVTEVAEVDAKAGDRCGAAAVGIPVESGWTCCPLDAPTCNCPELGGSPDQPGGCQSALCDNTASSYVHCVDRHGCPYYEWKDSRGCLPYDDAGKE